MGDSSVMNALPKPAGETLGSGWLGAPAGEEQLLTPFIQHTALVHCWPARLETTLRGIGNVPQADGHVCHAAVC